MAVQARELTKDYKYGFHDEDISVFRTAKGLSPEVVAAISQHKGEPEWMLKLRLKALDHFLKRPMPTWGADLADRIEREGYEPILGTAVAEPVAAEVH